MACISFVAEAGERYCFLWMVVLWSSSLTILYMFTFLYLAFSALSVFAFHSPSLEVPVIDREQWCLSNQWGSIG